MSRITKRTLLSIIKRFPFDALVVPNRFATDRDEDIPGFIDALTEALKATLLESAPARVSPRKLMEPSDHLAFEPATPTPTSTSMSTVVTAEEEEDIGMEPIPFMLQSRDAQEFEDEEKKERMKIDAAGTKIKVERDALEEAPIGAEGLISQAIDEGDQMGNITEREKLSKTELDVVEAQQISFLPSNRSLIAEIPGGRAEKVDSFDSSSIYQSLSLTQDPAFTKPIDLGSADDPVKLRRAALRNMALEGFPLHRTSNLVLADERLSSSNLPPPPDLPFDSKPKPMSPARRALMKDLMEETRQTLHYNPYILMDLGKELNLGLPMVYVDAVYEPYEYDLEDEPGMFQEESYNCVGWAVLDTAADCCYLCCDMIDITLDSAKRYGGYFTVKYVSYLPDKLTILSGLLGWEDYRWKPQLNLSIAKVCQIRQKELI